MEYSHIFIIPPISDWLNLAILFIGIFILIFISEITRKKLNWSQEVTRKIVHISVGLLMLLTPILLKTSLPLVVIALFFTVFNFIALKKNLLPGIHIDRHNLGTVYYAFSFLVLVVLFWENYKIIIIAAMMVMAVGDAAAAIVGQNVRHPHSYRLIHDQKTIEGSLTMFVVSTVAVFLTFLLYPPNLATSNHTLVYLLVFSLMAGLIATISEAMGNQGNDNLSVPLFTAIVLYFLLKGGHPQHFQFLIAIFLGAVVAFVSYRIRILTANGAMATFLLACVIFGFGGWQWAIPILAFFIFSSLLSNVGKVSFDEVFEKGSRRDYLQVWANGGIAGLLMITEVFNPHPFLYFSYIGALAAATADTWSTEIGMRLGRRPRLISNFKIVHPGTSGGVTLSGLGGALIGSLVLTLTGIGFLTNPPFTKKLTVLLLLTITGLIGSLVDSLLGATWQVQNRCPICQKITEKKIHCQTATTLPISGVRWLDNDMVNFINTIAGAVVAYGFYQLYFSCA